MNVLFWGLLSSKLVKQGYLGESLKLSFRKFYSAIWTLPLTNVKWHSYPPPAIVTSIPIIRYTNFMTSIPSMIFAELWVVSMEHLPGVLHTSRERLPFPTPGFVPFWDLLKFQLLRPVFRSCRVFSRRFPLISISTFSTFSQQYGEVSLSQIFWSLTRYIEFKTD